MAKLLVDGMSMRVISRVADVSIHTVTKLLVEVGAACGEYQGKTLCKLNCKRVQTEEISSFVGMRQKNVPFAPTGSLEGSLVLVTSMPYSPRGRARTAAASPARISDQA